jgi:hypothetical protein
MRELQAQRLEEAAKAAILLGIHQSWRDITTESIQD